MFLILTFAFYGGSRVSADSVSSSVSFFEDQAREYLKSIMYTHEEVDNWTGGKGSFLNPIRGNSEGYDDLLGWIFVDNIAPEGMNGTNVLYSYSGARKMFMYADSPCRINTYGDSFTHCDQVSDGETWQEVLAAHLCEPVRNFGIGGYSVYQAYLRMKQEETRTPAEYIIFNIYEDDHHRNLHSWRNIREGSTPEKRDKTVNSPTMPFVKVNLSTGEFHEYPNPCPTRESVFNMCNPEWVYQNFKDDFVLKIVLAQKNIDNGEPEKNYDYISKLCKEHGLDFQINSSESLKDAIDTLYTKAAIFASKKIIEKAEEFAAERGKKVLYVLSYCSEGVEDGLRKGGRFDVHSRDKRDSVLNDKEDEFKEGVRFDQEFIDFLKERNLPYVDLFEAHRKDFAQYNISFEDYANKYWTGHYTPLGNLFQAFAVKDKLVDMMNPKPIPYSSYK
jgi:hypothetical protein